MEGRVPLTRHHFRRRPSALLPCHRRLAMALANHRTLRHRHRLRLARACLPSTAAQLRQVTSAAAAAEMVRIAAAAAVVVAVATIRLTRRHWAIRARSTAAQTDTDHGA